MSLDGEPKIQRSALEPIRKGARDLHHQNVAGVSRDNQLRRYESCAQIWLYVGEIYFDSVDLGREELVWER